jgi:hypothetical protein
MIHNISDQLWLARNSIGRQWRQQFTSPDNCRPAACSPYALPVVCTHLGSKIRFCLLSDSCVCVDMGRPLWREDGSVVYNCCWSSPAHSYLPPMNSSGHFSSWILIQFLWWPLFCLLVTRPQWSLSWYTEISLRLLRTCSETNCLH